MPARILMFQGTGSDVGKSLIVAGLCRLLADRGFRVRPFKPQNMSNNAAVTADGGEIGRAQALQARAARVSLSVHMNPVLLKPQSETGAQIVVQGRMRGHARAAEYQRLKPGLMEAVIESFGKLAAEADFVLVEGAGSAAEVNLRAGDIANMGFAEAVSAPVILIGDIDRGGVIASLIGTKHVLAPADAARIAGFIVNRFRGDPALFAAGMARIAGDTGWAPIGLLPHFAAAADLPAEDRLGLAGSARSEGRQVKIVVPVLPCISNFDDLDPLRLEPSVELRLVHAGDALPGDADLVILPGSKATIADLASLRAAGWDIDIAAHHRRGGRVLGLCGGFQMLGRRIADPLGIEGPAQTVAGLGLLDIETVMTPAKALREVSGHSLADGVPVKGYEMHIGETTGPDMARPLHAILARDAVSGIPLPPLAAGRGRGGGQEQLSPPPTLVPSPPQAGGGRHAPASSEISPDHRPDGAQSANGRIGGTYLHGLFADDAQRAAFLARLGGRSSGLAYEARIEAVLDAFAAHLAAHLDIEALLSLAREPVLRR